MTGRRVIGDWMAGVVGVPTGTLSSLSLLVFCQRTVRVHLPGPGRSAWPCDLLWPVRCEQV